MGELRHPPLICQCLCLIGYSGRRNSHREYVHNSSFRPARFFTSNEGVSSDNIGEPEYWMPLPQITLEEKIGGCVMGERQMG